jgi:WD40 repeat protein
VSGLAFVMALMLAACLVVGALALLANQRAQQARDDAEASAERADLNRILEEVNGLLRTDPAEALITAQQLRLDQDHDPDGKFQDAFRRALDAADTDVKLDLGSPVVLADFVDDRFLAVTEDGHVRVWDVEDVEPMRLDEDATVDAVIPGAGSGRVVQAFAAVGGTYAVVSTDVGEVMSVDLSSGAVERIAGDNSFDSDVFLSAPTTGRTGRVLVWDRVGHGVVWDVAENRLVESGAFAEAVHSADIDPTGDRLAVLRFDDARDFDVQVWAIGGNRLVDEVSVSSHTGQTLSTGQVRFTTSDEPQVAIVGTGWQTELSLWDVGTGAPTPIGTDRRWRQIFDLADVYDWSAEDDEEYNGLLAVAGDKDVELYDANGEERGVLRTSTVDSRDWVTHVERNPVDTDTFAVASDEGYVEVYQQHFLVPPKPQWTFRGHQGRITGLAWSEDGERLATSSRDGTVRIWRRPFADSRWYSSDWILAAKYTPDGSYQFGFTPGGYLVRDEVDQESANVQNRFVSTYGRLNDMDPAPDGQRAAVVEEFCDVPLIRKWSKAVTAPALVAPTNTEDDGYYFCANSVAWNPDPAAHQIVAGTYAAELVAWDADTGEVVGRVELGPTSSEVRDVAYSGDGQVIVVLTGSAEDAATGRIHVLRADDLSVVDKWPASDLITVDVSEDGTYIATSGNERHLVQVWDTRDLPKPQHVLRQAGAGTLSQVTLTPDDEASWVAVTTAEGRVYVWDRESGRLLSVMQAHGDAANGVAFNPNDIAQLVSAGDDGETFTYTCELCSMDTDDLRDEAEDRIAQVITAAD